MTDEHRDWLAGHLTKAAERLSVTLDGDTVRGLYDRTLASPVSGPSWLRVTAQHPEWTKDEMWDGIATPTGGPFDRIPMPRHLRSAEWTADTLDTYSGAVAVLTAASKYLHHVENGEFPEVAVPLRRHVETVNRDQIAS